MLNKTIATAYRSYLNSSALLQAAVKPLLRGGYLPATIVRDFAQEHAHFYGASFAVKESGSVGFYVADEVQTSANRHEAAQKAWNRGIRAFIKTAEKRGGATRSKADPAEKFLKDFHAFDKATRARIVRLMKSEGLV